jgi:hypothetical protein
LNQKDINREEIKFPVKRKNSEDWVLSDNNIISPENSDNNNDDNTLCGTLKDITQSDSELRKFVGIGKYIPKKDRRLYVSGDTSKILNESDIDVSSNYPKNFSACVEMDYSRVLVDMKEDDGNNVDSCNSDDFHNNNFSSVLCTPNKRNDNNVCKNGSVNEVKEKILRIVRNAQSASISNSSPSHSNNNNINEENSDFAFEQFHFDSQQFNTSLLKGEGRFISPLPYSPTSLSISLNNNLNGSFLEDEIPSQPNNPRKLSPSKIISLSQSSRIIPSKFFSTSPPLSSNTYLFFSQPLTHSFPYGGFFFYISV